jgi:hypothetical protein
VRTLPEHLVQEALLTHINQLQTIPDDAKPLKLCGMLFETYYTYNNLREYSVLSIYKFMQNVENVS